MPAEMEKSMEMSYTRKMEKISIKSSSINKH